MTTILWADDDSEGLFRQLPKMFIGKGCTLHTTVSYDEALAELKRGFAGTRSVFGGLLVDVILPRKRNRGAISRDLGIELARTAIKEFGIGRVAFLTVVPLAELANRLNQLKRDTTASQPTISCFDKTVLLERDLVSEIVSSLNGVSS